jgi:hypothetical protein
MSPGIIKSPPRSVEKVPHEEGSAAEGKMTVDSPIWGNTELEGYGLQF